MKKINWDSEKVGKELGKIYEEFREMSNDERDLWYDMACEIYRLRAKIDRDNLSKKFEKWLDVGGHWTGGNQGDYGLEIRAVRNFIKFLDGGKKI